MRESLEIDNLSSLESNRRIFDIAGTSPSESDNLLFDSKRSFFGIFSSSDELIHVYDIFSQHKKLQDLSQSEIKILFLDSLSESSQSSTDNKIFGLILPDKSNEHRLFIAGFGNNSVNVFRNSQIFKIDPNFSQLINESEFHFYSSTVLEGDIIFLSSPQKNGLSVLEISDFFRLNQTKTAKRISQSLGAKINLSNIIVKI